MFYHWDENLGKVWASYDPEPGELPIYQSPFDPREMGRGLCTRNVLTFPVVFMQPGFLLGRV